jgi:hypothetical protein
MMTYMETMLLKDPGVSPTKKVLETALGKSFTVYEDLMDTITGKNYGLLPSWNYYKDGKAWLCKAQHKKKTVFWLSVWDKYFKLSFYFTEKTSKGINALDIDSSIKNGFKTNKPVGRLVPLVINVNKKGQLKDVLKIIGYKIDLL